jgi:hypothetical protein
VSQSDAEDAGSSGESNFTPVVPIRGATRLFALLLGLAFALGSLSFLRALWRYPDRFEWVGSRWLLTLGGVIFVLVGLQFCAQAAFPESFAQLANRRRRSRAGRETTPPSA